MHKLYVEIHFKFMRGRTQIDALTDEHITAVQLRDRAIRVACALLASGLRSGDCVSVCSANRAEFAYVLFGAVLAGVTLAPLNVTYTEGPVACHELHRSKCCSW